MDAIKSRVGVLSLVAALGGVVFSASGQQQIGFYNLDIKSGDNLIAYQLDNSPNNDINDVLFSGVLEGSTFTLWDPVANQLMPVSIYNGTTWSINYPFAPDGIGGVLHSPDNTTVLMGGNVVNLESSGDNTVYTFVPPTRTAGTFLLSVAATINGATFQQVIGRDPNEGDAVETLDAATQQYSTTTFNNGSWNNGTPSLAVGEAAYFELAVPEPSTIALGVVGAGLLVASRRLRAKKN